VKTKMKKPAGKSTGSFRTSANGIATKGKTKAKQVKMAMGGEMPKMAKGGKMAKMSMVKKMAKGGGMC
jgi:hypothetical protein